MKISKVTSNRVSTGVRRSTCGAIYSDMRCSICGTSFTRGGHNPWPIVKDPDKRCCDDCNAKVVVPERIKRIMKRKREEGWQ
jgi:hypothetical protein